MGLSRNKQLAFNRKQDKSSTSRRNSNAENVYNEKKDECDAAHLNKQNLYKIKLRCKKEYDDFESQLEGRFSIKRQRYR